MILYRNTKVKVRSPDWDTDYFDIVAEVLQGYTLAPYLFIICLDYVLRTVIIPASAVCISYWVLVWMLMWAGSKREAGSQRKEQDKTTTYG